MIAELITIGKLVTALAAIGGAVVFVRKRGWRPIIAFVDRVNSTHEIVARELKPNGGASIHDTLHRIERRIMAGEALDMAMLEQTGQACWRSDENGLCTWASTALCRLTGRVPAEIRGNGWRNTVHPEDRQRVFKAWDTAIRERREFLDEYRYLRPDGTSVLVSVNAIMVRDNAGNVIGHLGQAKPIGEGVHS